jgi:very-short-patch-repair endonuclease
VIEVDGSDPLGQEIYDSERNEFSRAQGLTVLRFTPSEEGRHLTFALDEILLAAPPR